jgi:hypothetical protein
VGNVEGFLAGLRQVGDPSADVVVAELARTQRIRTVSHALRTLVDNDQAGVGRALDTAQSARGPVGSLTELVGAGILNQRIVEMAGRHCASFSIPVPPELELHFTASGVFPSIDPELIRIAQGQPA